MRQINKIIVHCSANRENTSKTYGVEEIRRLHKNKGWDDVGYHYIIRKDGLIQEGRKWETIGAHAIGQNEDSIGVCYIGGLDSNGKPTSKLPKIQALSLITCLRILKMRFPKAEIKGHRDYSPDLNGNGIVEPSEWVKDCPCFDTDKVVQKYLGDLL